MRRILSFLGVVTLLTLSCQKTSLNPLIPDGIYKGTFQRLTSSGGAISNVTITFSADTWTGQSEFAKYPALCSGTYKTSGQDSIDFENACAWTAEFDWSLILSGKYKIKTSGRDIEITREYIGVYKDIYLLTKQ